MKVVNTDIPGLLILEPRVFGDDRGYFMESYNRRAFQEATGLDPDFVQDNHSRSQKGVLRGLHYQIRQAQDKLVRVVEGEIYDVVVDIRKSSPTFGQWMGCYLSAENKRQLWVPKGFAHGFCVTSAYAQVLYKTSDYYAPEQERSILWNDPALAIEWPVDDPPLLSDKDCKGVLFRDAEYFS